MNQAAMDAKQRSGFQTKNSETCSHACLLAKAFGAVRRSGSGRADQRNHLAFVPAVNAKILVRCDHAVVRIKLAHPDQTKIGQIGLSIRVALG